MLKFNLILAVGSLCTAVGHCVTVLLTLTLHFRVRVRLTLTLGGFLINVGGFYIYIKNLLDSCGMLRVHA